MPILLYFMDNNILTDMRTPPKKKLDPETFHDMIEV